MSQARAEIHENRSQGWRQGAGAGRLSQQASGGDPHMRAAGAGKSPLQSSLHTPPGSAPDALKHMSLPGAAPHDRALGSGPSGFK